MDHPLKSIFSMFRVILRKKTHGLKYDLFSRRSDKLLGYLVGPILEVVQYQADPRQRWSKLLALRHLPKSSLISLIPHGDRIRY